MSIEIVHGPKELIEFDVTARSFEGRLPARHRFRWKALSKDEARQQIVQRWPALYDIEVREA